MANSRRIFLAHAKEDVELVRKFYADLKKEGFEPWLDEEDLDPGAHWPTEIPKAIQSAAVFIACLSSRAVDKIGYIQNELRLALASFSHRPPESIFIIPVLFDDCRLPDLQIPDRGLRFGDYQAVDLRREGAFERLKRSLTKATGHKPVEAEVPPVRKEPEIFRDIDEPWCPEMVALPSGTFLMGSPEEEAGRRDSEGPQHEVRIAHRFALGRYPVTFEEYDHFTEATGRERASDQGGGRGRRPVINVSWIDAQAYLVWLRRKTGSPYCLPSEAEWEYACRAGTMTRYSWGNDSRQVNANYGQNIRKTTQVGNYLANPWGLHDMHGNVWEWCEDVWHDNYEGAPGDGTAWTEGGEQRRRVLRGGSWVNHPVNLRSASRFRDFAINRYDNNGFRVAKALR